MEVLEIAADEPEELLQRAFDQDSLLNHYPIELRAVTSLLQMARDLIRVNSFIPSRLTSLVEESPAGDVVRMMQSTFLP
jgi:hypothetical protein